MNKTQMVFEVFNSCAAEYQDKFMNVDGYTTSLDLFCSNLTKNADVLELACGPGNITKYLLQQHPGLKILGIDLAPNMIELAKANNPLAEFMVMDCRAISSVDKKFDAIMCGFCLPYLSKEEAIKLLADAAVLLNENGILYLSTMEDDYNKSGLKKSSSGEYELYMYYHEANYLTAALEHNNFEVIKLIRQPYPAIGATDTTDLIIIARK